MLYFDGAGVEVPALLHRAVAMGASMPVLPCAYKYRGNGTCLRQTGKYFTTFASDALVAG